MLAPFVWIFVCFAAGVIASTGWHLAYPIAFAALASTALSLRAHRFAVAIAAHAIFFVILGWSYAQLRIERHDQNELKREVRRNEKDAVSFSGVILRAPEIAYEFFVIEVGVDTFAGRHVAGTARVTVAGAMRDRLLSGDRIKSFARFRLPVNFGTPGAFDYRRYLEKEGIDALGSVKNASLIHKTRSGPFWRALPSRIRLALIRKIQNDFPREDAQTLRALWLDDRAGLSSELEQQLIDAGIFHVIAISGFHIAVLIAISFFILRVFLPYRYALICISLLLLFYFLLLEGRSSITRSFLTFLVFSFAYWRWESVSWSTVLFVSAFLQILINPLELFDVGYQLTYLSTAAIVFIAVPIASKFAFSRKTYRYFSNFIITMLSVQFVLLPYQAYVFHKIPFGSFLANFAAIPLSSLLIGSAPVVFTFSGISSFPPALIHRVLALFFANTSVFNGTWLRIVPTPPIWLIGFFYFSLALALLCRKIRLKTGFTLFCLLCIAYILWFHSPPETGRFLVHFIDVGQGDAILLQYPDGSVDMIDSGGFWNADAFDVGASILLPYLSSLRVSRLHRVFLTHAHADHMSGFLTLLRYIPCDEFYVTRRPVADPGFQALVFSIPMRFRPIQRGASFRQGDVLLSVLAPSDSAKSLHVRNDDSLVLLAQYQGKRILLPGDAERPTEEQLLQFADLHADFLKVAHHGSKTSTSAELLQKLKPKAAFISVGKNNWFGHPNGEVVNRLRKTHVMVYRTDQLGTITLAIDSSGHRVESYAWQ